MPHQGASNEYPQHMFSWRNKTNINTFGLKKAILSRTMFLEANLSGSILFAKAGYIRVQQDKDKRRFIDSQIVIIKNFVIV